VEKMHGLDLFSGIGGISFALQDWIEPVAFCEIEKYCQAVLLSRMHNGELAKAPIWDNITTLQGSFLPKIDIIYGGFPCQDISIAGLGKGLEGQRSGLFFEIVRLAKEIKPKFIFLENVPAITSRGGLQVIKEIASLGYDCRWCIISAQSVGAMHKRERWFLLANSTSKSSDGYTIGEEETHSLSSYSSLNWPFESREHWQKTVSEMGKCSDGLPYHVDRLRALGNSVVPQQVKQAFKILIGKKD